MLNKVMLIGRLGGDPELRYMPSGDPVTNFNVATDETYIDKDGNRIEKTEWHRVVVFKRQAENCSNYLSKGSLVYIEGKLQTRKWQDQQGQNRSITEVNAQRVQFLDRKGDRAPSMEGGNFENESRPNNFRNVPQKSRNYPKPDDLQDTGWDDDPNYYAQQDQQKAASYQRSNKNNSAPTEADMDKPPFASEADMDKVPF